MRNYRCARLLPPLVHWTLAIPNTENSSHDCVNPDLKLNVVQLMSTRTKVWIACVNRFRHRNRRNQQKRFHAGWILKLTFMLNVHSTSNWIVLFWMFGASVLIRQKYRTSTVLVQCPQVHNNASSVIPCIKFFDLYLKLKVQALLLLAFFATQSESNDDEINPRTGWWCRIWWECIAVHVGSIVALRSSSRGRTR